MVSVSSPEWSLWEARMTESLQTWQKGAMVSESLNIGWGSWCSLVPLLPLGCFGMGGRRRQKPTGLNLILATSVDQDYSNSWNGTHWNGDDGVLRNSLCRYETADQSYPHSFTSLRPLAFMPQAQSHLCKSSFRISHSDTEDILPIDSWDVFAAGRSASLQQPWSWVQISFPTS